MSVTCWKVSAFSKNSSSSNNSFNSGNNDVTEK